MERIFAEVIDGRLCDRGLLHRVVPQAEEALEARVTVLLTNVGLYEQTAFREGG